MLHTETVTGATLGLLKALMRHNAIDQFILVGGTNLSLRLGHRRSIDIDLFTSTPFEPQAVTARLMADFPNTEFVSSSETTLFLFIEDVKTDMVSLPYQWLLPPDNMDGLRLASLPDIAAMKLSAVARRGVKKDFWDIAELLEQFTIEEMIGFYRAKYASHDIFHLLRALVYFQDAEAQKDPDPLKKATWKQVKQKVQSAVQQYIEQTL